MEFGQRFLIDRESDSDDSLALSPSSENGDTYDNSLNESETALMRVLEEKYGSTSDANQPYLASSQHVNTIRFQVILWDIGKLDVASGSVAMTFRVSLFWEDRPKEERRRLYAKHSSTCSSASNRSNRRPSRVSYAMKGRTKAVSEHRPNTTSLTNGDDTSSSQENKTIDVPPLSILNVSTFITIGSPEVDMLDSDARLMRWTCMYRATVMQNRLSVHQFPHDCHEISLQFAILANRRAGQQWDRRFWRLALATEDDNSKSTRSPRTPHGLVVDHVRIPDFHFHRDRGLTFHFCTQENGAFERRNSFCAVSDVYLHVSLMVLRESGYYDRNIVPLLALLNVVAATVTLVLDPEKFFFRGLLILNIAFNEVGLRMAVDKHLPSVGYEIRMQRVLNEFFFILLALILESGAVYALEYYEIVSTIPLKWVDVVAGVGALVYNYLSVSSYYAARKKAQQKYDEGVMGGDVEDRFSTRSPQVIV